MIHEGPHYELPAAELAKWVDQQGDDCWWTVDGDLLLIGRLSLPCPGDELSAELRAINRPLLVAVPAHVALPQAAAAKGQTIEARDVDALVETMPISYEASGTKNARWLYLCWKGSPEEWMLLEDVLTTESSRQETLDLQREGR